MKPVVFLFLSLLSCGAGAADIGFAEVERAFARADAGLLLNQVAALDERVAAAADPTTYYLATYARYRLAATYLQQQVPASAKPVLKRAIGQMKALLKTHPDFADGLVLLAAVYGLEILRRPFKAVVLGPRANRLIERALVLEPANPRAYLMKGVVKFQTPTLFGGSIDSARELLETGLANIQADTEPPPAIHWGLVDLHLWLGRVAAQQEQWEREKYHYETALLISPDNYWVLQAMEGRGYRFSSSDSPGTDGSHL